MIRLIAVRLSNLREHEKVKEIKLQYMGLQPITNFLKLRKNDNINSTIINSINNTVIKQNNIDDIFNANKNIKNDNDSIINYHNFKPSTLLENTKFLNT
jgi:hypothetical protein